MPKNNPAINAWIDTQTFPTYLAGKADLNPMFFETRVNQGSSGKTYPIPFTDRLTSDKVDKPYQAIHLENEYVKLMLLPELGGRIHMGRDKTNGYDFVYYNQVIKPALIGLAGPWIAGGIEWNWPQHHRPTTFLPVDARLVHNEDGSSTAWVGEIEPLFGLKGMVGVTLHPGRSYFEAKVQLYNPTPLPQTFMWWANLGVHVNDQYQVLYPPDVDYVVNHARRSVSSYPLAKGNYYGVDYMDGVDISWYKNIPVPSSYMVLPETCAFDFWGGYDHGKQAGVMHIANHHVVPGKKLFTWGTGDFGTGWCNNLTDENGPYVELMTGAYTDNQPDFTWIAPYETKTFSQFWYPLRDIGQVQYATLNAAVNLEVKGGKARIRLNTTQEVKNAALMLVNRDGLVLYQDESLFIAPDQPFDEIVTLEREASAEDACLSIFTRDGEDFFSYVPHTRQIRPAPQAAQPPEAPGKFKTNEDLYITGLHLEQYRHPTIAARPYYEEALKRDPQDARANQAVGLLLLRQGEYTACLPYLERAAATLTQRNFNPYDGEVYYHLGLALHGLGKEDEAYTAFYKAIWNYAWRSPAYTHLALIDCAKGDWSSALQHANLALESNQKHLMARNLKAMLLWYLDHLDEAAALAQETTRLDPLDFTSRDILARIHVRQEHSGSAAEILLELEQLMSANPDRNALELAFFYTNAGLDFAAVEVLERRANAPGEVSPLIYYHLAHAYAHLQQANTATKMLKKAAAASPDYCFPDHLESEVVLRWAMQARTEDGRAPYYLGNLYYDKHRYAEAIVCWEKAAALDKTFAIPHRNLGMAYYNISKDPARAKAAFQQAFSANPQDGRILHELDQLERLTGKGPADRLTRLDSYDAMVQSRDDLYIERIVLCNLLGQFDRSIELFSKHTFRPWEGGEGKVSDQYIQAHLLRGWQKLIAGDAAGALTDFKATLTFPASLGEGRHAIWLSEANLFYHIGRAYQAQGNAEEAAAWYQRCIAENKGNPAMHFYQGLALRHSGDEVAAKTKFDLLMTTGRQWLESSVESEKFPTSIPSVMVLKVDQALLTRIGGSYMLGLGHLGLGQMKEARQQFEAVLSLDGNHLGGRSRLQRMDSQIEE